jgi:hypothetical protein
VKFSVVKETETLFCASVPSGTVAPSVGLVMAIDAGGPLQATATATAAHAGHRLGVTAPL